MLTRVVRLVLLAVMLVALLLLLRNAMSVGTVPAAFEERITPSPTLSPTPTPSPTPSGPRPFQLTFTEQQLTDAAKSSFPQTVSGLTVSDPVVRITRSDVRLFASARFLFGTTQFAMSGVPYASGGGIAVRVDSVTLGGVALPESARTSVAASVQSAIAQLVSPTATVQNITLGNGTMTIEGVEGR